MRLLELRQKKGVSQKEVANTLYLSQTGYSSYENERTEPNIEILCKLADYYNVSIDYLVGRETKNEIGYLSQQQLEAVKLLQSLNEINLMHTVSFMQGLFIHQ